LREFLDQSDTGRQAIAMSASDRADASGSKEEYEMSDMPKRSSGSKTDDLDDL
jgi:hypothetical protein